MEENLRYANVEIKVRKKGAELFSAIVDGEEFIWNGKEHWAKSSPILFPFVGGLLDGKYIYKGKEYSLNTRHGFARDKEFELLEKTENKISYVLLSNEETKKVYPFDFKLVLSYEILNENSIKMEYKVYNTGKEEMYFSLGYHTAFFLPTNFENYYLKLDKKTKLENIPIDGAFVSPNVKNLIKENSDILEITDKLFENDAIIFDGNISNKTEIIDKNSTRKVSVIHNEPFDYVAYWRPQGSQFVCVEPWYGITDFTDTDHKLETKKGIVKLEKDKTFTSSVVYIFEK
ncbi:aldose 1-epimerase family protein [Oceanivirga miroungae]|uniref:Aldose 1-epimerase n=1 Tax=Oceanivirga miroungae TaxID=1130046 RepID=A0A6I8MCH5_9FUSO|nr:aldose 1-epimerase family protein [Oceanivirga miroungae]VWL85944.1 aldose 1-epimerase [Oceanivirga miroungae]